MLWYDGEDKMKMQLVWIVWCRKKGEHPDPMEREQI